MATPKESVFLNVVAFVLYDHGFSPSRLEWCALSRTYNLCVNQLGVPHSERFFTIFEDQFLVSVADRRLLEAVSRNLLNDAAIRGSSLGSTSCRSQNSGRTGRDKTGK